MANEIYRLRSDDYVVEEEVEIGDSGAKGIVKVNYYLETIIEHSSMEGGSAFGGKVYLNVTSVSTPIQIWIGYTDLKLTVCGKALHGKDRAYKLPTLGNGGGIELISGETYPEILLFSFDAEDETSPAAHNFIDGELPFTLQLAHVNINIARRVYANGYTPIPDVKIEWNFPIISPINGIVPIEDKSTQATTADNFTDENTNPRISYTIFTKPGNTLNDSTTYLLARKLDSAYKDYRYYKYERITLEIGLSLDGVTLDVPYQPAPVDGNFTFNLTEEQLDNLRKKAVDSNNVPIYYMFKTTRKLHYNTTGNDVTSYPVVIKEFYSKAQRVFTVVGCKPVLNPTVRDVNSDTIALTGNPNIFVRYESMVEFTTGAIASKYATIVNQSVQCGSKTIYNLYNGVIDDIESGSFIFNATDSRGLHADTVVVTNTAMIEYVKPTCNQDIKIEITGETGAIITVNISGNYYSGSFGAVDNELQLYIRYKTSSGDMGEWIELTGSPVFNDNKYELSTSFTGLSYDQSYTFQCKVIDKLNVVETSEYVVKVLPVFDWSKEDFNFNVPVKINGETILRHNETAKNTVLSASGGRIYLRPKGTDETVGQTIFNTDGSIDFSGVVNFGDSFTIGGNALVDYVVDAGEEAMGSNGTWYWRKWASGKAEAWGCRNFGNMAVTTAWGNLYRSEILTQDLPEDVFKTTPDVININIVNGNFGGWICKHENLAPSAATTGSFIWVRPASATISPTYIGFYVIGIWK